MPRLSAAIPLLLCLACLLPREAHPGESWESLQGEGASIDGVEIRSRATDERTDAAIQVLSNAGGMGSEVRAEGPSPLDFTLDLSPPIHADTYEISVWGQDDARPPNQNNIGIWAKGYWSRPGTISSR